MSWSLTEAERFYREALGWTLIDRTADQLVFELAGVELRVFRCDEAVTPCKHSARAATACIFEVDSLDTEMSRMRARGVVFIHDRPAHGPDGAFRYAAFHTPGGNVHEIVERRAAF